MSEPSELTTILSGLGGSADAVAATLRDAGIRGVRNTVRFLNPIIRYCLARLRLDDYALDVTQRDVMRMVLPGGKHERVPLPDAVKQFLDAFNRGAHPELEVPPEQMK
jgi:hypothetical protein